MTVVKPENESMHAKQGYNHANYDRLRLHSGLEDPMLKFLSHHKTRQLLPIGITHKPKVVVYSCSGQRN